MLRGVLFDLDGTLLDIHIDRFLEGYFARLGDAVAELVGADGDHAAAMNAIFEATAAMMRPHAGRTNRDEFYAEFHRSTGIDLFERWDVFDRFYAEVFPTLRGDLGPVDGARQALEAARAVGLKVALATNPIFPRSAIVHRLSWTGIHAEELDAITDFETMHACKPYPEYFRETAALLGLEPAECLMVGDDRALDLPAADVGMRTFYVGPDDAPATYRGGLRDFASLIGRLAV